MTSRKRPSASVLMLTRSGELRNALANLSSEKRSGLLGPLPLGDVALDPEVPEDPAGAVVQADVVALDPDRRAVELPFVGLDVEAPGVEDISRQSAFPGAGMSWANSWPACCPISWSLPRAVLREHRVVDLGDPLVGEDVVERCLLVGGARPVHRLVEHHEEEAVERLGEEQLQQLPALEHSRDAVGGRGGGGCVEAVMVAALYPGVLGSSISGGPQGEECAGRARGPIGSRPTKARAVPDERRRMEDYGLYAAGATARAASRGEPPHWRLQARRSCRPDRKPAASAAWVTLAPRSSDCRARSSRINRR